MKLFNKKRGLVQVCVFTETGRRVYVCPSCGATRWENEEMMHYEIGPGKGCSDRTKSDGSEGFPRKNWWR